MCGETVHTDQQTPTQCCDVEARVRTHACLLSIGNEGVCIRYGANTASVALLLLGLDGRFGPWAARRCAVSKTQVYRIRKCSGYAGGSNWYHHADVISTNWQTAMKAAREGRVSNWRWIDRFDSTDETYVEFEYLYIVDERSWDRPEKPAKTCVVPRLSPPKRSFVSYLARRKRYGAITSQTPLDTR